LHRPSPAIAVGFVAVLLHALPASAAQKARAPRFADYPVAEIYKGPKAEPVRPPDLAPDDDLWLRLDDNHSPDDKINAAGHYVLATWSCGTACVASGLVDAITGKVIYLPSVSDWRHVREDFEAVQSRANSRLIVMSGALNDGGVVGLHYFVLDNGALRHIRTIDTKGNFRRKAK
jgi:hypothetical protein